jgi:hypothetical protein
VPEAEPAARKADCERRGEIGNEQSYLRFKAKEHERATAKPAAP